MARTSGNLITENHETLETSVGGWASTMSLSSAVVQSADFAHSGTKSLKCTRNATVGENDMCGLVTQADWIRATPGQTLNAIFWMYSATAGKAFYLLIDWYSASGVNYVNTTTSTSVSTVASTWTQVSGTHTVPAGAVYGRCYIMNLAGGSAMANGQIVYFDDIYVGHSNSMTTSPVTLYGSTEWAAPSGTTSVQVEVWGGGGAGGGGIVANAAGGGGAGGAYASNATYAVTAGNSYVISIGVGGAYTAPPTTNTATAGSVGGDTYFDNAANILAKGGAGGGDRSTAGNGTGGTGTATGSIGTVTRAGGNGSAGASATAAGAGGGGAGSGAAGSAGSGATGGAGGTGTYAGGAGGNGLSQATSGGIAPFGSAPGGGGGGGRSTAAPDVYGGDGAPGRIILTFTSGPTPITDSDTGAGTETHTIAATLSDIDTGAGTETQSIGVSDTDTGAGTETEAIAATLSDIDTGDGTETQSIAATLSDIDTGSGVETESIAATLADTDTGTGVETHSLAVTLSDIDTATGTDTEDVSGGTTPSDTEGGGSSETESIAATLSDIDTGLGSEDQLISLVDTDTSSGSETQSIAVSDTDTAAGTETYSLLVTLSDTDTAIGTESQTAGSTTTPSDTEGGGATETESIQVYWLPVNERSLVQGPATLYIASFGAVEPVLGAVGSAPDSGVWTDLGGTLGGVELTVEQEWFEVELKQIPDKPMKRLKKRRLTIKTQLAEPTLANLSYALNDTPSISAGVGWTQLSPSDRSEASQLTYNALIVDGWAPQFNITRQHKRRRVVIRKALSIENVQLAYTKDGQSVYTVTWSCHYVDSSTPIFRVIDQA